jgi:hypothetical protein
MDRLWSEDGMQLEMVTYAVMETGFETGYIEFVDNSKTISEMHRKSELRLPTFRSSSLMTYFVNTVAKDDNFSKLKSSKT